MWFDKTRTAQHREIAKLFTALQSQMENTDRVIDQQVNKVLNCPPTQEKLFSIYRDYLKHEDDLINNRLNWNFTIQGFLFAAYSFALEKVADIKLGLLSTYIDPKRVPYVNILHSISDLEILLALLAFVGMGVSFFVYISVRAARYAIHELEMRWRAINPGHYNPPDMKLFLSIGFWVKVWRDDESIKTHGANPPGLPGLVGGGHPVANLLGFHAPNALPLLFVGVWLFLFVDALFDIGVFG